MFSDLSELEPGTSLRVSRDGIEKMRYWSWHQLPGRVEEPAVLEQTQTALTESLREHLVSDVPIGVLLSGGIDSSLLVALLAKELGEDVETFTVSFAEAAYDESPFAETVARSLGVRHRKIILDTRLADISVIDDILDEFDQPFGDSFQQSPLISSARRYGNQRKLPSAEMVEMKCSEVTGGFSTPIWQSWQAPFQVFS